MLLKELYNLYRYWQRHPIASKSMNKTVKTFIRWQIGTRILKKPIIWSWINGINLVIERGMTGATMNMYCGLHEFYDMSFLLHFLRTEDTFVDIGANIGTYTLLASGVAKSKSISVEPVPATFQRLLLNLAVNHFSALIQPFCCGIGSENNTFLSFITDQDTTNRVAPFNYSGTTVDVSVRTMDSLLENTQSSLWKIDVEGFEEEVLSGATKELSNTTLKAIIIEGDSPKIRQTMYQYGFVSYHYNPFERVFTPNAERRGHNFLYIRDLAFVENRCKTATSITVNHLTF